MDGMDGLGATLIFFLPLGWSLSLGLEGEGGVNGWMESRSLGDINIIIINVSFLLSFLTIQMLKKERRKKERKKESKQARKRVGKQGGRSRSRSRSSVFCTREILGRY